MAFDDGLSDAGDMPGSTPASKLTPASDDDIALNATPRQTFPGRLQGSLIWAKAVVRELRIEYVTPQRIT